MKENDDLQDTAISLQDLLMFPQPQLSIGIVSIIAEIPLYKLLQPSVQVRYRPIVELLLGGRDVRVGERDVTITGHVDDLAFGFHVEVLL